MVLRPGAQRTNQLLIRSPRCLLMSCLVRTDYYYLLCNSISSCTWKLFELNGKFWVKVLIIQALTESARKVKCFLIRNGFAPSDAWDMVYKAYATSQWFTFRFYSQWDLFTDFTARQQSVSFWSWGDSNNNLLQLLWSLCWFEHLYNFVVFFKFFI